MPACPCPNSVLSSFVSCTYMGDRNFRDAPWVLSCSTFSGFMLNNMRLRHLFPLLLAFLSFASVAKADVAVLLEEPYSYDGALAGTGQIGRASCRERVER